MEDNLLEFIEEEISNNHSLEEIRILLRNKGYSEEEVRDAINKFSKAHTAKKRALHTRFENIVFFKEILDRIGYGMTSHQFINILFYQTGASLFLVGLINGLRTLISLFFASFISEYAKVNHISKHFIRLCGIIFGISFLFMALGRSFGSVTVFTVAILLASLGVVSYGELYLKLLMENLRREKSPFVMALSKYGVIITMLSMMMAGYILDLFPPQGTLFHLTILGKEFPFKVQGHLIIFEVSAVSFIISSYLISLLHQEVSALQVSFKYFIRKHLMKVAYNLHLFLKRKITRLLLVATILTGIVQILVNSYLGIYIYDNFSNTFLGGFANVAFVFMIAVASSLLGHFITRKIEKYVGLTPVLVFANLLIAITPLTIYFNPRLPAITVAVSLSIIGGAIIGLSQALITRKILREKERALYFGSVNLAAIIPSLLFVILGSYLVEIIGIEKLFLWLGLILIFLVTPLYFILVVWSNKYKI